VRAILVHAPAQFFSIPDYSVAVRGNALIKWCWKGKRDVSCPWIFRMHF
jgi:hypothetical protein